MTDLLELAERVEAGENGLCFSTQEFDDALKVKVGLFAKLAINGSLNDAKNLHDAVLPGWYCKIIYWEHCEVVVANPNTGFSLGANGKAETLAAAWVAAILRAKATEGEKE